MSEGRGGCQTTSRPWSAAAFDKGVSSVKPQLKGALIAACGPVRAKPVAYLSIAKDLDVGWDTRLFDTLQAARAWLEADR